MIGAGLRTLAAAGGWPLDVAIAGGPWIERHRHHGGLPTWDATYRLRRGDQLHLDLWGPAALNYQCDIHRSTVVGGSPTAEQEHYLEGSVALIHHLVRLVRPGYPFARSTRPPSTGSAKTASAATTVRSRGSSATTGTAWGSSSKRRW